MSVCRLIPVRKDEWVNDHFRAKFGVSSGVSEDFEIGQKVKVQIWAVSRLAMPDTITAVDVQEAWPQKQSSRPGWHCIIKVSGSASRPHNLHQPLNLGSDRIAVMM